MQRVEDVLVKVDTLMALHDGALPNLYNRKVAVTTTFNNLLRTMIDSWPISRVEKEEVDALYPLIMKWTGHTHPFPIKRELLQEAIDIGLGHIIPFIVVRFLMRNHHLQIGIQHTTPEWREFVDLYAPLFDRLKIAA